MQTIQTTNSKPLLSFEFATSSGQIEPLTFNEPIDIITAISIEDVLPCFQLIQAAVDKGYYAAGYLSYESAPAFDSAYNVQHEHTMPLLWFGIFSNPVYQSIRSTGTFELSKWEPSVNMEDYHSSIKSIKNAIEQGNTYQTNYTIRLHSLFKGDDIALFQQMKNAQDSNYCAYINTGEHSIVSASPELFFHLEGEQITTKPMKGTMKRGKSFTEDEEYANWLYHSEKNRAENVMIVDLLRNDLNRIAESGSVQVDNLFEIERYPTVHQMTSTISAKIPAHTQLVDIFKALFPCGSITGAPKISTMEIIADLEKAPRDVYCGAIGYITPDKEAIFNVPIRTIVINQKNGIATYGVGGGITWDSTTESEYHEILTKASLLEEKRPDFQLLESILLSDGNYHLLNEHLMRLKNSATYFGFLCNIERIIMQLTHCANKNRLGQFKIRLLLSKEGEITIDVQALSKTNTQVKVALADQPVNQENPFFYHKTTNREMYAEFQEKFPTLFDVILWNRNGELTEFTNGNIVLELDGSLWTPPIHSGLLAGTFRQNLIENNVIQEKVLKIEDLKKASKIWFINSIRSWIEVQLI